MTMNGHDHGRLPLRRARSNSEASSVGRSRRPERLCDGARTIRALGRANVDDGSAISATLASVVSKKAFLLRITVKNEQTEENEPYVGQAGLIRGERLTASPPLRRQAVEDAATLMPIIRSSHFKATPVTALHNVVTEPDEHGVTLEYKFATLVAPAGAQKIVDNFSRGGLDPAALDNFVIRPGDDSGDGRVEWEYGHDVDSAAALDNPHTYFTRKDSTFEPVKRPDYQFANGQKIGIAVYRDFIFSSEDAGEATLTSVDILRIYGEKDKVNVYTGEITRVCAGGDCFEHNVNTFRGCSGAIVFLLDQNQDGFGILEEDYGKAIAVHVGGDEVDEGDARNFAFKIPST
jgi:hypothetical protein